MCKSKKLYVITDESLIDKKNYFNIIDSVLSNKPEFIQLRMKNLPSKNVLNKAKKIREISSKYNVKFIVNDFVDVALECNADGVHIGNEDESFEEVRSKIGHDKILGVSCYGDVNRCVKYAQLGADYIAIGTPFYTKTKPEREPTSIATMLKITSLIKNTDIYAIGGINASNIDQVISTNINGVAVINAVFSSINPGLSTREILNSLKDRV